MKLTVGRKLLFGLTLSSSILVVLCGIAYWRLIETIRTQEWVSHTNDVLFNLENLHVSVMDCEVKQRSYVITGNQGYLQAFNNCSQSTNERIVKLKTLTRDNPAQESQLLDLEALIKERFKSLQKGIELHDNFGIHSTLDYIRKGYGLTLMERVGQTITAISNTEKALLANRMEAARLSVTQTKNVIVAGLVFSLALVVVFSSLISRSITTSIAALTVMSDKISQGDLLHRAHVTSQDELGQLADSFNAMADKLHSSQMAVTKTLKDLESSRNELQRSNAELEQFAYIASHDLQEPLRMVASYTQLLGKRYTGRLDQDADEFIQFAVDGAKRMQDLINDLLAYSRLSSHAKDLKSADLNDILDSVLLNLKESIDDSGAVINRQHLPTLKVEATQVGQLFQNLIANAIKFQNSQAPEIQITAERNNDEWIFSIKDNGIGIEMQFADRIFNIFERLHGHKKPGTGIGLAICKRVVERHGGTIWMDSNPGKGSTFYFTLPASS